MAYLDFFPQERIELQKEVRLHPELMSILSEAKKVDFEVQLAHIAAYCGIALDGVFYAKDLDAICDMLVWKLRSRRTSIILPM